MYLLNKNKILKIRFIASVYNVQNVFMTNIKLIRIVLNITDLNKFFLIFTEYCLDHLINVFSLCLFFPFLIFYFNK